MSEQTQATDSTANLSLAEYRALRENPAEASQAEDTEDTPVGESEARTTATKRPVRLDESLDESGSEGDEQDSPEQAEDEKPAGDKPKAAKKGGWQRKLEKAERENAELRAQLAAKPAGTDARKTTEAKPVAEPHAAKFDKHKPKLEDFDSIDEHVDALTDWKLEKRDFEKAAADKAAKAKQEADSLISAWTDRVSQVKTEHADYDRVMEKAKDIAISPAHQRIFLDSEHGAHIAYDLASDPDELKKFAALSPLKAAAYFGKLESAYESDESPKTETPVSKAPKPARPVGGRASSTATLDVAKMSLFDWRRARESGRLR